MGKRLLLPPPDIKRLEKEYDELGLGLLSRVWPAYPILRGHTLKNDPINRAILAVEYRRG